MPVDPNLNVILKEMWRLDEKISAGEALTREELAFYHNNLQTIVDYYQKNNEYWQGKKLLA